MQGRDTKNAVSTQGARNLRGSRGDWAQGSLLRRQALGAYEENREEPGVSPEMSQEAPGGSSGGQVGLIPKEWGGENPLPASGPTVAGMAGMSLRNGM